MIRPSLHISSSLALGLIAGQSCIGVLQLCLHEVWTAEHVASFDSWFWSDTRNTSAIVLHVASSDCFPGHAW